MTTIKKAVRKATVKKATPNNTTTIKGDTKMTTKAKQATPEAPATEEAVKMTPIQMCEQMHKKGMSEDEMIQALTEHAGLGIIKAVAAYKNFLKSAGLTETLEEKKAKAFACIEGFVNEDGTIDAVKAVTAVAELMEVGNGSARARVKAYCKENKIEMPAGTTREKLVVTDDQKAFIIESKKAGDKKKETAEKFHTQFPDVPEKNINTMYNRTCKDAGLVEALVTVDHAPVIAWYETEGKKYDTRGTLATALMAKFPGMAITTAKRYWNFFAFAKMYHTAKTTPAVK